MSKFLIRWDKKAVDFLRKLDKKTAIRIINKIEEVAENPKHYIETLKNFDAYKVRVGEYRVIVDLDIENKTINILYIGHRKSIYKRL